MWYFTTVRSLDKAFIYTKLYSCSHSPSSSSISFLSSSSCVFFANVFQVFLSFFQLVNYAVRQNLQFSFPLNCFSMQDTFNYLSSPLPLSAPLPLFHLCLFFRGLWTFGFGIFAARNIWCLFFLLHSFFHEIKHILLLLYYYYYSFSSSSCTKFHLQWGKRKLIKNWMKNSWRHSANKLGNWEYCQTGRCVAAAAPEHFTYQMQNTL